MRKAKGDIVDDIVQAILLGQEVELEISELDLTAAESKATYEEIRDYVLEPMGLKVSSLCCFSC